MKTKTRAEIINDALRIRNEIIIDRNTVEYWNCNVRKEGERRVEYDPDGRMRKIQEAIETGLRGECFALYIVGMDEYNAAPSLPEAERRLRELTAFFSRPGALSKHAPRFEARIEAWPGTREEHAEDCKKWEPTSQAV